LPLSETLSQHEKKPEKTGINEASMRQINRNVLSGHEGIPETGTRFVHVSGSGCAKEGQGDGFIVLDLLDDQIVPRRMPPQALPSRPNRQRKHASHKLT
jgi:hypothetical protein